MGEKSLSIFFNSSRISQILFSIFIVLIAANIVGLYFRFILGYDHVYGLVEKFNFDIEISIPTFFSSVILLIAASLLGILTIVKKRQSDTYVVQWAILSIIFLCLSIDEAASLHEMLIDPLRNTFNLTGIFYFSWVIPGFIFVSLLSLLYFKFTWNLPPAVRNQFIASALIYLSGAIGVELIGGHFSSVYGENNLSYGLITSLEESLEMFGVIFFIKALLGYIEAIVSSIRFVFN